jgi:transcriptional regulator with XRE-family HTH domain
MATTDPAVHTGVGTSGASATSGTSGTSAVRREELAEFLRGRRARISPTDVGLSPGMRRRTPGLRREEVAQLAGVGVTWYTWLEQGRDINASAQVLDAIARTLRFDELERSHLFTLAGTADGNNSPTKCAQLTPAAELVLDRLEPYPALAVNARFDILDYNRVWLSAFPRLESLPREDRNCLWLIFTCQEWRRTVLDWDEAAARMVAQFRASMAEHVAEPAWKNLVARLNRSSPEFAEMWARHDIRGPETAIKRIQHPLVGLLRLTYTYLWLDPGLGTRIVTYTPVDNRTAAKLQSLQRTLDADGAVVA